VEGLVFEGMKAGVNTVKNPRNTQERIFKYIRLKQESHLSSAKQQYPTLDLQYQDYWKRSARTELVTVVL
jgi:hypothetical protein